ncbi:type II toxin-antitoxin system prevent-host-death family antitoxin [Belnapia rosea]|uniref:Prevent-host-death family protein n=1 Tax=Belnapia rosea TaxID=938405 RepID=A0A1G6WWD2_9PROT|nr:type II toxin-antitoxin system prevent-host-death family antitoxin [Belnapia rosea]SDD70151.1 prevent-host-death family protein [Belnapia rosea]
MAGWLDDRDLPVETEFEGDPAPGLEGLPRMDLAPVEAQVPSLIDQAVRGPIVLTRNGAEAFVLLPLDIYRRLWSTAPRPPVLDAEPSEPGPKRRTRRR